MKINNYIKWVLACILFFVFVTNFVAYMHAFKFTNFTDNVVEKTKDPKNLTLFQKLKTLLFGVNNPKPKNSFVPKYKFETIKLNSGKQIEGWYIQSDSSKGTIVLFHGYGGEKVSMLDKAELFYKLGYNTMLIDFRGCGNSEGSQTTIGYYEADDVKCAYQYLKAKGERNILLFGTSMGAVAIMRAVKEYKIEPILLILECPYGTMLETVQARFNSMNVPTFPMANLLVFWGGVQNDFNAFEHNPEEYAKAISCPTLLLHGKQDDKVSMKEINAIYKNLKGEKQLKIYSNAGHENYLIKYKKEWFNDVRKFLN